MYTSTDREPRAGRGVDPGNVRRALDVAHGTAQYRLRTAKHQAVVYAAELQVDSCGRGT